MSAVPEGSLYHRSVNETLNLKAQTGSGLNYSSELDRSEEVYSRRRVAVNDSGACVCACVLGCVSAGYYMSWCSVARRWPRRILAGAV